MRTYEVFADKENRWKAVKDGFSWPAFFFTVIWSLFKKLWLLAFVWVAFNLFSVVIEVILFENPPDWWKTAMAVYGLALSMLFGIFGNHFGARRLEGRGYESVGRLKASSGQAAIKKFQTTPDRGVMTLPPKSLIEKSLPGLSVGLVLLCLKVSLIAYYIPGPAMQKTLQKNDRIFANRFAYILSGPEVGDIVIFRVPEDIPDYDPGKPVWIKRIVGTSGDRVEIEGDEDGGRLLVNGQPVANHPFLHENRYFPRSFEGKFFNPVVVPEGHVMVFGDNSIDSYDSRYWGTFPADRIVGKAIFRYWPFHRFGEIEGEPVSSVP
jgi:signal peptidase I